jgi:hypothetical protein
MCSAWLPCAVRRRHVSAWLPCTVLGCRDAPSSDGVHDIRISVAPPVPALVSRFAGTPAFSSYLVVVRTLPNRAYECAGKQNGVRTKRKPCVCNCVGQCNPTNCDCKQCTSSDSLSIRNHHSQKVPRNVQHENPTQITQPNHLATDLQKYETSAGSYEIEIRETRTEEQRPCWGVMGP